MAKHNEQESQKIVKSCRNNCGYVGIPYPNGIGDQPTNIIVGFEIPNPADKETKYRGAAWISNAVLRGTWPMRSFLNVEQKKQHTQESGQMSVEDHDAENEEIGRHQNIIPQETLEHTNHGLSHSNLRKPRDGGRESQLSYPWLVRSLVRLVHILLENSWIQQVSNAWSNGRF